MEPKSTKLSMHTLNLVSGHPITLGYELALSIKSDDLKALNDFLSTVLECLRKANQPPSDTAGQEESSTSSYYEERPRPGETMENFANRMMNRQKVAEMVQNRLLRS